MIFDAGDMSDDTRLKGYIPPPHPDDSRSAGEWIGRYIKARHPNRADARFDYTLISHYHGDHLAYYTCGDLQEPMEQAIAWTTGPVDMHVTNHHGSQAHPFSASFNPGCTSSRYGLSFSRDHTFLNDF